MAYTKSGITLTGFIGKSAELFPNVAKAYFQDRRMAMVLAASIGGLSLVTTRNIEYLRKHGFFKLLKQQARDHKAKPKSQRRKKPAVDGLFWKRLKAILAIAVPSYHSKEAMLIAVQTAVLVARSLLSLRMARLGGDAVKAVVQKSWEDFGRLLMEFFLSGVFASAVNSGLKYLRNCITANFRLRLTRYVHKRYLARRAYYKAAVLRVGNLDNADQRIVEDLNKFCETASDLYQRTFKPAIDVVLNTMRMADNMGYSGLLTLYSYFCVSGVVVRTLSPPMSRHIAKCAELEGDFRRAHGRLITHAEEVAFLDGAQRENEILEDNLNSVMEYTRYHNLLKFKQGCVDQFSIKYLASMVGWPILAIPFLVHESNDMAELAARYRESDSLIQAASSSVGDLMMVYPRLQKLAGYTARVAELLEAVDEDVDEEEEDKGGLPASMVISDQTAIEFKNVTVHAPGAQGRLLLKDLNLTIKPGDNVLVTGANGAGKTSLFRVLAGLWAARSGEVVRPATGMDASGHFSLFYMPQRPYLVTGSLRDQVTYPKVVGPEEDEKIAAALAQVNLTKLTTSSAGLGRREHDWSDVLSGGEQQRVGMARLYYHQPKFAVLDEATSAINPDEEGLLYQQLDTLGITVFSIAHRMELAKFHKHQLHFAADGTGNWDLTNLN